MFEMEKDNRILIGAIFIFLILFIVVGSRFNGVSGNVVLEDSKTSIFISPEVVSNGEIIYVTVTPGKEGVNEKVSFYQAEDDLRKTSVNRLCNSHKCYGKGSFSFDIPSSWESGVYYVKVYDYEIQGFVVEDFTIRS